jgi:hypothetical protein
VTILRGYGEDENGRAERDQRTDIGTIQFHHKAHENGEQEAVDQRN